MAQSAPRSPAVSSPRRGCERAAICYDGGMACASLPRLTCSPVLAALLLACGPTTGDESGDDSSSTGTADPTAADPTTDAPTTTTTTGETGTSGDTGDTGDTGASDVTGETTGETTGAPDGLVLDPETLVFFELPIGSIRYAVGGFDPAQQTCVTIIFYHPGEQEHCDDFKVGDTFGFPYVYIYPSPIASCTDWDYGGNVQLDAATGCMQVVELSPTMITIDMQLTVSGAAFTGTISVASE